ncbi:DJ-1/PfpI family protein, partial [Enterobacter hormaechei]
MLEALRYAAKAQDKLAFKISLISEFPDIPIISNAGIIMRPDSTHAPPDSFNYLAVIGGELQYLDLGYQGDKAYLAHAHHAGVPLIGIGTGSFVLAQEGLLNERRASIHPFHLDAFRQAFPLVYAEQGYDFIDDGDVLTCPGGISTLTLATELIRAHAGDDIASTTCQRLSLVPHEIATPRPANLALIPDSRLRRAVMLIEQFLTRPLTTAGLAREVALSERQLNR